MKFRKVSEWDDNTKVAVFLPLILGTIITIIVVLVRQIPLSESDEINVKKCCSKNACFNLFIDRSLLKRGYLRLGDWLSMPAEEDLTRMIKARLRVQLGTMRDDFDLSPKFCEHLAPPNRELNDNELIDYFVGAYLTELAMRSKLSTEVCQP